MGTPPETLFKHECERRGLGWPEFEELFNSTAHEVIGKGVNNPTCSERTYRRWRGGQVGADQLSHDTRRVLKAMFAFDAATLFAPPRSDSPAPAFNLEQEIEMTAREAQDDATATAAASVSDTSLDQLTDDVIALAREYASIAPGEAFRRGRNLREELFDNRDRTQIPAQRQRLLELTGQTVALLAASAFDLGAFDSARRLARSADLYGEAARFEPLRAFADGMLAYIAYFTGMPTEAVSKARRAQSYGGLGDVESARRALLMSAEVDSGARDDLHDGIGGEFGFTPERLAMSSSSTALLIHDGDQAAQSARRALELIGQKPEAVRSAHVLGGAASGPAPRQRRRRRRRRAHPPVGHPRGSARDRRARTHRPNPAVPHTVRIPRRHAAPRTTRPRGGLHEHRDHAPDQRPVRAASTGGLSHDREARILASFSGAIP